MVQTVAVIGAGASGLTAIKSCIEEGLNPTCYEMSDSIGGLWHYNGKVEEDRTTVMKSTVANACKELTAYSDFPPPVYHPAYMHHTHMDEYLCLYADHFDLRKHIQLNTKVVQISETDDHEQTGQWCVKVKNLREGVVTTSTFDAVLLCTGVFSKPIMPAYPGLQTFKGRLLHVHEYKTNKGFEDKTTLVVGFGNSAADAAVDISDVAKQVYISSRNGTWIFNRLGPGGQPNEMARLSRLTFFLLQNIPSHLNNIIMGDLNAKIDHTLYGLNPKVTPLRATSTVNDLLAYTLVIGTVKTKAEIKMVHENSVEFVDGSKLENVDIIVCGTGYLPTFPFLDPGVIGEDTSNMYLGMFPPERKKQTMAAIGCFRQKGPILPVTEMQCRLATRVFKDLVKLPDKATMWKQVQRNQKETENYRTSSKKRVTHIDFLPYMDELASMIGCKPSFFKLLFRDPWLAKEHIVGPGTAYQYRLIGPHTWHGARDAIVHQWNRTYGFIENRSRMAVLSNKRNYFRSLLRFCIIVSLGYVVFTFYGKKSFTYPTIHVWDFLTNLFNS